MLRALAVVICGAVVLATTLIGLPGGARAQTDQDADRGQATMTVQAPDFAQPLEQSFAVTVSLTTFTPGTSATWAGYDLELAYDPAVLQVERVTGALCDEHSGWGLGTTTPHVVSGCAFQSNTATGVIETLALRCVANGWSALVLVPRRHPQSIASGTALFDEQAADFAMTFRNRTVTCGSGPAVNAPPAPPADLLIVGDAQSLTWDPGSGNEQGYTVEIVDRVRVIRHSVTLPAGMHSYTIPRELTSDCATDLDVLVRAFNSFGASEPAVANYNKTCLATPQPTPRTTVATPGPRPQETASQLPPTGTGAHGTSDTTLLCASIGASLALLLGGVAVLRRARMRA